MPNVDYWETMLKVAIGGGLFKGIDLILRAKNQKSQSDVASFAQLRDSYQTEFVRLNQLVKELRGSITEHEKWKQQMTDKIEILNSGLETLQKSVPDLPVPMALKSVDGVMLSLNNAYEKAFLIPQNLTRNDYIGHTDSEIWGDVIAASFHRNDKKIQIEHEFQRVENENYGNTLLLGWVFFKYPVEINDTVIAIGLLAISEDDIEN